MWQQMMTGYDDGHSYCDSHGLVYSTTTYEAEPPTKSCRSPFISLLFFSAKQVTTFTSTTRIKL